jgi:hypothetical protein
MKLLVWNVEVSVIKNEVWNVEVIVIKYEASRMEC